MTRSRPASSGAISLGVCSLASTRSRRARATTTFGKLRVWDTQHNNGVLIYLLLAEHEIELVAGRGLNTLVSHAEWEAMVQRMAAAFARGHFEDGLTQALAEVSAPLVRHFPAGPQPNPNDLPDSLLG